MIILGPDVYTEKGKIPCGAVQLNCGKIQRLGAAADFVATESNGQSDVKVLRFPSNWHVIPGMLDLHVHGVAGADVMDADARALQTMSNALPAEGVTGFLATTMTASAQAIDAALLAFAQGQSDCTGAVALGVHLEGPFLSASKMGAQSSQHIIAWDAALLQRWQKLSGNNIKLLTLAPEECGQEALSYLQNLTAQQIILSMGHSNATYAQALAAINDGCSYATHLFNAMRELHHREPGVVLAALLDERVTVEVIADGMHLHAAILQMIFRLKGADKIILITDAMRAKGMPPGTYDLGGQQVIVQDNTARLANGTLASSTLTMDQALRNMMQFTGCSLADAIKMASTNPAQKLGMQNKGSIAVGKDADLVVLDEKLHVKLTVIGGCIKYIE